MSQERTEQRDPVKDREFIAESRPSKWQHEGHVEAIKDATLYYIELSEQRREERDSNQRLHIQSLEEIDRLNAVNAEQAEYIDAINKASDGLDTAVYLHMCHIEKQNLEMLHLEALEQNACEKEFSMKFVVQDREIEIWERDETIRTLTAKVQERDERIEYMDSKIKELTQAWDVEKESVYFRSSIIRERDKEIERLRAGITSAIEKSDWAESDDNEFPRLGYLKVKAILWATLKGAE